MRMTKKTLLVGTIASFFIVGCGDDSSEANQEEAKPKEKKKVEAPAPEKKHPEPEIVAKDEPPEAPEPVRIKPNEEAEKPTPTPDPKIGETTPKAQATPSTSAPDLPKSLIGIYHRANTGDAQAQFHLAQAYENGTDIEKDMKEATKWLRMSAEQGNRTAAYNLAMLYSTGRGVEKDEEEAEKWFAEADKNPEDSVNKIPNN